MAGSWSRAQRRNAVLHQIRYLWNRFLVVVFEEFAALKVVATSVLTTNPTLSYFCIFPYRHDPTQWIEDKKEKVPDDGHRRRRHGITFIRSFEDCYVCTPWIVTIDRKPCVDEVFAAKISRAVLAILFYAPSMSWHSLYHRCVLKYLLTPMQLLRMCQVLRFQGSLQMTQCARSHSHVFARPHSFSKHPLRFSHLNA